MPCPVVGFERQYLVGLPQRPNLKLDHPLAPCRALPTRQHEHGKHFPTVLHPPTAGAAVMFHVLCGKTSGVINQNPICSSFPTDPHTTNKHQHYNACISPGLGLSASKENAHILGRQ